MNPSIQPTDASAPAAAGAQKPASPGLIHSARQRRWHKAERIAKRLSLCVITLGLTYLLLAYVVLPAAWRHYEHHPELATLPKITSTANDIPGDPLNVGLVGSKEEVVRAVIAAGWQPADAISLRSSLRISESAILNRPYPTAPVSNLYLLGRRQDLAFERPVGESARQRHHVRLWLLEDQGAGGRPLWVGSATFDQSVGISHRTGQITHHIAADVDAERNQFIDDLRQAEELVKFYQVTGVGATLQGRNGGGDWYYSDGELTIGAISPENKKQTEPPEILPNPPAVELKDQAWEWLRPLIGG
ncbi:MAG TPA: LssY C-terminal domain-containing protein [Pirellulales bacterium]|nr:LssY C-terminal domain-containing protein [Pirellulales bacterium]